jgi:hypothetical protein
MSISNNPEILENKNVAQGRFEYSHSPDNRALTKPYPVTTYLVANFRTLQPMPLYHSGLLPICKAAIPPVRFSYPT